MPLSELSRFQNGNFPLLLDHQSSILLRFGQNNYPEEPVFQSQKWSKVIPESRMLISITR